MARTKEELKADVKKNVDLYNEAVSKGDFKTSTSIIDEIDKDVEKYDELVTGEVYQELKESEDPMLAAINKMQYLSIRVRDVRDKDLPGVILKEVDDAIKNIDLIVLHKMCKATKGGIGKDTDWIYEAETFNMMLTADKIANLTLSREERQKRLDELSDSFAISKAAKKFALGKKAVSETEFKNELNKIVKMMLGEEYNIDVACMHFIHSCFTKNGKNVCSVATSRQKSLVWYIAQVCHHIVTKNEFSVIYPEAKVKK